ncbi:MAG: threonine--tRNA ligase [Candidatus Taylorbacteria bacterium RIFCSPHIGHO2_01_FULL_46_22b]|uniref:Threonine--tRNA ligase n=1 Tax=Candidatus Taylorbacteria bacterium RIFCSPHIGHO2_01_FULL_46_22b TaxID=1802301 RepID=A0A1G2M410_9BACT|nr:MAG: threonine--tRNA ligase [Candidatus Taylorbacteria bacterium RIFCSPHIGHO2_01_FULL_46_22b]
MSISLEYKRHSLAHLLAAAVLDLYPEAKPTIGPAIDNGFYYDFDNISISEKDLQAIEKKMRELVKSWKSFEGKEVSEKEAGAHFKDNPYKLELIGDIAKEGSKITFYTSGDFTDLCRGGHSENPSKDIAPSSWKLDRTAGAYWRGNEKNAMLTRIYGLAFDTKEELENYQTQLEEAKKRDHKKLGQQLKLFMFHETAPGMPYWLPKGLILYNELVDFWRKEHREYGYQEIASPLVNKAELWKTSGHWDHYKDDMFIADMGENEVYGIKPMNCPNAMLVFQSMQVSYKDLPVRLSDTDRLHRYERSGTLNGLFRCRSFQQDDSHNYISEDMIASEYAHIFEICKKFYGIFNLSYSFRLGTRPEKFLGEKATWDKAEQALRDILKQSGVAYTIAEGDGAFYGPKVDILMKDSLGRDWQMGTIQLDFQQPLRFGLEYTDKDGKKKTPVVVHRVVYGSLERFIGVLIEHTAGAFPLWLSPVQVVVLPVSEKHEGAAREALAALKSANIRAELSDPNESLGKRVREVKLQKIPYWLVIGDKDVAANMATLESRNEQLGQLSIKEISNKLLEEIKERK